MLSSSNQLFLFRVLLNHSSTGLQCRLVKLSNHQFMMVQFPFGMAARLPSFTSLERSSSSFFFKHHATVSDMIPQGHPCLLPTSGEMLLDKGLQILLPLFHSEIPFSWPKNNGSQLKVEGLALFSPSDLLAYATCLENTLLICMFDPNIMLKGTIICLFYFIQKAKHL